jgi:hypothetical protein
VFCVAVDKAGNAITYNGTSWSTPSAVDPGEAFNSVSCRSKTFCAAVDDKGGALTWDGTAWSSRTGAQLTDGRPHLGVVLVEVLLHGRGQRRERLYLHRHLGPHPDGRDRQFFPLFRIVHLEESLCGHRRRECGRL